MENCWQDPARQADMLSPFRFRDSAYELSHLEGSHMGGCQNDGPFLDPYYNTAPNIQGTQKGTIILTTTHIEGTAL